MKKKITLENGKLNVQYDFTAEHQRTLVIILANEGVAEFENREPTLFEDVDGNQISWKICDELVEMGLLDEDEESYDVFYELNQTGRDIIMNIEGTLKHHPDDEKRIIKVDITHVPLEDIDEYIRETIKNLRKRFNDE